MFYGAVWKLGTLRERDVNILGVSSTLFAKYVIVADVSWSPADYKTADILCVWYYIMFNNTLPLYLITVSS